MQDRLIHVQQVARYLGVSRKRVYQMVSEGKLDSVRLSPRALRITESSINQFIKESLVSSRDERGVSIAPPSARFQQRIRNRRH